MKIKELQRTVNVAWSPAQEHPIYLATGTAAQTLDTNFNSNASIELYNVNLADPSYDMTLAASQASQYKFHKVVWSPFGAGGGKNGTIVGGCEGGHIQIYNPQRMLAGEDGLVASLNKHNGTVTSLDYNPFQGNLLASAASESEIFIWDLNNTATPMTPGTKTQPFEDVQAVSWNRQVQHILASVLSSRCIIWDLRKNEPIIRLSDTQSRVRWRVMQWHPENATQLWLASEEDHSPTVQLWDLRYATSPTKALTVHQRGILGLTWCQTDHDLMVSCGKDNRILCWNPNSNNPEGEILSEIASTVQWYSDVQWCPRNPALIASSSLDGNVTVYSVFGGSQQQVQTTNKIADSFPGMDNFSASAHVSGPQATHIVYSDLAKPPKFLGRRSGASFAFGGKLVTFDGNNPQQVRISQVVTEPGLVESSQKLEQVLNGGDFVEYCRNRADEMVDQQGRYLWYFLKANFEADARAEFLNLLGYQVGDIHAKLSKYVPKQATSGGLQNGVDEVTDQLSGTDLSGQSHDAMFEAIAAAATEQKAKVVNGVREKFVIPTGEDTDGLIAQAILTGNTEAAVELCMSAGRTTEAVIIAITGDSSLLSRTQLRYFEENTAKNPLLNLISALVTRDCTGIAEQSELSSWKEALVAILVHSSGQEEVAQQATILGERLEQERTISSVQDAILCFICADNLDKLVDSWELLKKLKRQQSQSEKSNEIGDMQELIEVVMIMRQALQGRRCGQPVGLPQRVEQLLVNYGMLLANQGAFESALKYVSGNEENEKVAELSQRLYYSLGLAQPPQQKVPQGGMGMKQQQQPQQPYLNNSNQMGYSQPQQMQRQPMYPSATPQPPSFMTPAPIPSAMAPTSGLPGMPTPFGATSNQVPPTSYFSPAAAPPAADPMPPPRPPSAGSATGGMAPTSGSGGGLPGRNKYPRDPSVQSGPGYGAAQNYFTPSYNNAAPMAPVQPVQQQPMMGSSGIAGGAFMAPAAPIPGQFNPSPMAPSAGVYGGAPDPMAMGGGQMGQPPMQPMGKNPTPPPGWNDPPAFNTNRAPKSQTCAMSATHSGTKNFWGKIMKTSAAERKEKKANKGGRSDDGRSGGGREGEQAPATGPAADPITHPIFGVDPNPGQQQQQQMMGMMPQQQQGYGVPPPSMGAPMPGAMQNAPVGQPQPQFGQYMQPQQQQQQQQGQQMGGMPMSNQYQPQQQTFMNQPPAAMGPTQTPTPEPAAPPMAPQPKAPLPEEYVYLQTVFNELRQQCSNAAGNPQMKRKLDDVAKRLESLYDLLRENRLTPNTLANINQMVQYIQIGDYANGLGLHTQMCSGNDFAQLASFMPGIKVLLQAAMQLQVFLR